MSRNDMKPKENDKVVDLTSERILSPDNFHDLTKKKYRPKDLYEIKNRDTHLQEEFQKQESDKILIDAQEVVPEKQSAELQYSETQDIDVINFANNFNDIVYYISDLHIENFINRKLSNINLTEDDIKKEIEKNIIDMCRSIAFYNSAPLLIAGDVAHTNELSNIFYKSLSKHWFGPVLSVLGNHEIWDFTLTSNKSHRSLNEIVKCHQKTPKNIFLLHNQVYCQFHGAEECVLNYENIIRTTDEELSYFLHECGCIVIGGTGFSGNNKKYNASTGLYQDTIQTIEDDLRESNKFKSLHDKIAKCASDLSIIVLTHNPPQDWTTDTLEKNWTYIHGHTHHNCVNNQDGQAKIYAGAQMGYGANTWRPGIIPLNQIFDPFWNKSDGIYQITSEQYGLFNIGRHIFFGKFFNSRCEYAGQIIAIKRKGYYMFALKTERSLCILNGGQRKRLQIGDIFYYYEKMPEYVQKMQEALQEFFTYQKKVSADIKRIGGDGKIHGCIVDIDYYNHVFVNPYDGTLTYYNAPSPDERVSYSHIEYLLSQHCTALLPNYKEKATANLLPTILPTENDYHKQKTEQNIKGEYSYGREMYRPSRIIRSLDYLMFNNVIRLWDDNIFNNNNLSGRKYLPQPYIDNMKD